MTSELDLKRDGSRGERAAELLRDETLGEALTAIERACIQAWEGCELRDAEGKEKAWQLYMTAKKFRAVLTGYVETGKLARDALNAYERKQNRLMRLLRA